MGCSDTSICININTTGIKESTSNNELLVYPNPGMGIITIATTQQGKYSLVNELGQTVCILQLNKGNNYTATLEKLSSGLYILIGSDGKQLTKQRIVVEQ